MNLASLIIGGGDPSGLVLHFAANKAPDFVALYALAEQIAQSGVMTRLAALRQGH